MSVLGRFNSPNLLQALWASPNRFKGTSRPLEASPPHPASVAPSCSTHSVRQGVSMFLVFTVHSDANSVTSMCE